MSKRNSYFETEGILQKGNNTCELRGIHKTIISLTLRMTWSQAGCVLEFGTPKTWVKYL